MRDQEIDRLGTLVDKMVSSSERNYQQWLTSAIDHMKADAEEQDVDATSETLELDTDPDVPDGLQF